MGYQREKARIFYHLNSFRYYLRSLPWLVSFFLKNSLNCFNIFTHLSISERLLLYHLGTSLPRECRIIEIGSYLGASSLFLAAAAKEKNGKVFCIDTWLNDAMSEERRDTYGEFRRNTSSFSPWIETLRGTSEDAAREFRGHVDMVFIDGDHSYDGCRSDVLSWISKIRDGGIIILHDYRCASGVRKVVSEGHLESQTIYRRVFDNTLYAKVIHPR